MDARDLKKSISLLLIAEKLPIHIDVALTIIYVYYVQAKRLIGDEELLTFSNFVNAVNKNEGRRNVNKVTNASYVEGCQLCYKWFNSIDSNQKKEWIDSMKICLKLIEGVEDNGYISFSNKLYESYSKLFQKTESIEGLPLNNFTWIKSINEKTENPPVLNSLQNSGNKSVEPSNKPFIELYDSLKNAVENRDECKYTWQWLLSSEEYEQIKKCLEDNKSAIPTAGKLDVKSAKLFALYMGEFYKREYNGNSGQETLLRNYSAICDKVGITYYTSGSETNRWKFSLYVNGGLPINYIVNKLKNNDRSAFVNCLFILFDPKDELDIEEGKQLLNKLGNTSIVGSYNWKDSIYEYIDFINKDLRVWNKSDDANQMFIDFKKLIDEGKKAFEERAKFRFDYSLWKFNDELELSTVIRFNVEENGERHYAINESRLKEWGITAPKDEFRLILKDADKAITNIRFWKCCYGDYIEQNCVSSVALPLLSKEKLEWGKVSLQDCNLVYSSDSENKLLKKSVFKSPEGYIQLYTNDNEDYGEQWTSNKGGRLYLKSAIMFDINRIEPLNCRTEQLSENIGWAVFKSQLSFKDKKSNRLKTVYNSKGSFIAVPTNDSLHKFVENNIVICEQTNMLKFEDTKHNEDLVYIIKPSGVKFDIIRENNLEKLDVDVKITYTQGYAVEQEYNSRVVLNQGYVLFGIRFGSCRSSVPCFVLNDYASVKVANTGTSYRLDFNGIEGLAVISKGYILTSDNRCSDSANGVNEDINFEISDVAGSLKFSTYRPTPAVIAKFPDNTTVQSNLLLCFAEYYNIRVINGTSSSYLRLTENKDVYKFLLRALTSTIKNDNNICQTTAKPIKELGHNVPDVPLVLRTFTHEIQDSTRLNSDDFYFLTFYDLQLEHLLCREDRPVIDCVKEAQKKMGGNAGILFQSTKRVSATETLYASKYIPGKCVDHDPYKNKMQNRKDRLSNYAARKEYTSSIAIRMFDLANEHGLYFAQFDNLLSILWDNGNSDFISERNMQKRRNDGTLIRKDTPNPKLYQRVADFLNKYSEDHPENFSVDGLLRLSREFLFDWAELEKVKLKSELCENAKSILKILIETKN